MANIFVLYFTVWLEIIIWRFETLYELKYQLKNSAATSYGKDPTEPDLLFDKLLT